MIFIFTSFRILSVSPCREILIQNKHVSEFPFNSYFNFNPFPTSYSVTKIFKIGNAIVKLVTDNLDSFEVSLEKKKGRGPGNQWIIKRLFENRRNYFKECLRRKGGLLLLLFILINIYRYYNYNLFYFILLYIFPNISFNFFF